jgi:hypothetical protein
MATNQVNRVASESTGAEFLLVAEALAVILRNVWQIKENPPFSM